jgi:hypothetical protein
MFCCESGYATRHDADVQGTSPSYDLTLFVAISSRPD